MDIFVIHSRKNSDKVDEYVSRLQQKIYGLNAVVLKENHLFWKKQAEDKIKKSQLVLFVVGEKSHESPYIGWEIAKAKKLGKPVFAIKISPECELHEELFDSLNHGETYDDEVTVDQLCDIIAKHNSKNYSVLNQKPEEIDKELLLEQYKIFLQTSEDLVARRQSVNNFYISINSVLMTLFGALFVAQNVKMTCLLGIFFSIVGIILSVSWKNLIVSYGNLNGSKMAIISHIEKFLPASLYDAEWEALSDRLNKRKYVSFTDSETIIPRIFIVFYIGLIILSIIILLLISSGRL